ncbi:uncharacterized protein CTRU02_208475 [Colletotrichum truncatum]|uniref:Uncharacterized protein n=1 Tax=Colletotrichum truncatum TaxID=5467 RepID=A0ACC3YWG3_COLTU|nr:uncharacterized protein CTRU02_10229 [Colletotrichum truncatum]KAF6787433.1 hypothetical protein CTRU02_10229 [Colletotrichum truncatum]
MPDQRGFEELCDVKDLPRELYAWSLSGKGVKDFRDGTAVWWLQILQDVYYNADPKTHGRNSWGYTVLRTVYTNESDKLFPIAVERLKRWVVSYYVHSTRFPSWGARGIAQQKTDGSVNDELGRRFRLEVLEDKDRLNFPSLENASHDDVSKLCKHFRQWTVSVGADPNADERNPRLHDFLAMDENSVRFLAALTDETPPLRVITNFLEKREWLRDSDSAYLWLLDSRAVEDWDGEDGSFRGWMKMEAGYIGYAWFQRARRMDREKHILTNRWAVTTHLVPEGSGDYWFEAV